MRQVLFLLIFVKLAGSAQADPYFAPSAEMIKKADAIGIVQISQVDKSLLYFSAAKQSKTRQARIEKCMPRILNGKGLEDR
jgi:hypothetical protein